LAGSLICSTIAEGKLKFMLDDKDRIFRNLDEPPGLGPRKVRAARGAWDGTQGDYREEGAAWITTSEKPGPARSGRRWWFFRPG